MFTILKNKTNILTGKEWTTCRNNTSTIVFIISFFFKIEGGQTCLKTCHDSYYYCQIITKISVTFLIFDRILYNLTAASKVSVFRVFLVRIFPHSNWIQKDMEYLSVFSPNTGKNGTEKLRIRTLFKQCTQTICLS